MIRLTNTKDHDQSWQKDRSHSDPVLNTFTEERLRIFSTFGLHWKVTGMSVRSSKTSAVTLPPIQGPFNLPWQRGAPKPVMNLAPKRTRWEQLFDSFSSSCPPFPSHWLWDKVGGWNRTSARLSLGSKRVCVCVRASLCVSLQSFWL